MGLLDGHAAIVTGGASGIGRATCRRLAEEGARVAVLDLNGDVAESVASDIDGRGYQVDVGDADQMRRTVEQAARAMGGLSILFNNAGVGGFSAIDGYSPDDWDRVVRVNLYGVFHGLRAAASLMLEGGDGRIVNTASISGVRPAAGEAPYSAAKAGIAALTASAALEYAPHIRVNAVSPGLIRTGLTEPMLQLLPDHVDHVVGQTPVGRMGEPEDVADVVVFLCSDLSRFVTGQNLVVDGGLTLHTSGVDGIFQRLQPLLGRD
ncbi:MAG TPA: SDR family NAD(P)-dependent oxidoreductase [Acidimicrobiales bacterium]|nr:SDR family NAD(P)-dependent oxidoreductase [Acidimicrobiales bacterium]